MTEAFTFNREFDFVRLDRLCRTTGRPAHEWDFYILKELIDNALDADEILWRDDSRQHPILEIRVEYAAQQLFVQVSNRSPFPVDLIPDIFATQQYTSRKAFIKGLTRGALGNALKTLLGIPYALRNRVAGDWRPDQKPLAILCNGKEYLPTYQVDTTQQTIQFTCAEKPHRQTAGTTIRIALDYFEQENPRTLAAVQRLAAQYRLCNPHVAFRWQVEVGEADWSADSAANPDWCAKFGGVAPIHWYSLAAFQDLLGALHRQQNCKPASDSLNNPLDNPVNDPVNTPLSVAVISSQFSGFSRSDEDSEDNSALTTQLTTKLIEAFGQSSLAVAAFESEETRRLYRLMCDRTPAFDSLQLGQLGEEHIRAILSEVFPLEGEVFYHLARDSGKDPSIPFLLESAIAPLKTGSRAICTAINFAPTYDDPFRRRHLTAPIQPDNAAIGLREFLDLYGIDEDAPVVFFLHLICPTVEPGEYSKTEINHLPFKQAIGEALDRLLRAFIQAQEDQQLQLERTIFQALDAILNELKANERFAVDQLLEKLRSRLSQDPALADWLQTADAAARLSAYLSQYQSQNQRLNQRVARAAAGTIVLPLHPNRHFSIPVDHLSQTLLTQNHVSKLLWIQVPELEPVALDNGWLCRLDLALLRATSGIEALQATLLQCAASSELPILVLRNGDGPSLERVKQLRREFAERQLDASRIVDLSQGLTADSSQVPARLLAMMPDELFAWVQTQLERLQLAAKFLPLPADIRQDISQRFEQFLLSYLWDGIGQQLVMPDWLSELDRHLHFTQAMQTQALDRHIQQQLQTTDATQSYSAVLATVVAAFFQDFLTQHRPELQRLTQTHLQQLPRASAHD